MGKHTKDESGKSHKNSRDKLQKRDKKQKHKRSKSKIKARHKSAKRNRADLEYEASPQRRPRVSLSLSRSPSPLRTAWPTAPQHRIRSVAVLVPDRLHPAPAVDLAAEPQRSAAAQEAPEANGIAASHRKLDYARRDGSPATEPSRPSVITVHGESPANLRRMALQGMRKHIGQSQQINGDAPQKDSVGQYGNSLQMQGSSDIRANMFSTPRNLQQPDDTDTRHDKAQSTSRQQLQSPDQPAARSSDYQHGRTSPEDDKNHRPSRGHSPHRPTARSIDYYHGYSSQKNDRDHTPLDVNSLSSDPLKVRTDVPSRDGDESLQGARSGRHAPPNGGEALQEGPSNRRAPPNFGVRSLKEIRAAKAAQASAMQATQPHVAADAVNAPNAPAHALPTSSPTPGDNPHELSNWLASTNKPPFNDPDPSAVEQSARQSLWDTSRSHFSGVGKDQESSRDAGFAGQQGCLGGGDDASDSSPGFAGFRKGKLRVTRGGQSLDVSFEKHVPQARFEELLRRKAQREAAQSRG